MTQRAATAGAAGTPGLAMVAPGSGEPGDERRKVARLLRWMSMFIAWPALSTAAAFWIWDATGHVLHMTVLFAVGAAAIALFILADRVAARFA